MSTHDPSGVRDASASSAEAIEERGEAPAAAAAAIDRHDDEEDDDTGNHDAVTEDTGASTAPTASPDEAASSAEPGPDVDSAEASTGGTSGSSITTPAPPASEAGASSPTEKDSAPVPTAGDEAQSPPPPPRRRRPLPPPPRKGILRPPSSSHAATTRFSFRRDILQPFNSSYSRAGVVADHHPGSGLGLAAPPLVSERGAAAAAAVGEAVGNAAATAGGFFGNALKRLSAATAVAAGPVAHAAPDSGEAAFRAGPSAETATPSAPASVPTAASTSTTSVASTSSSSSTLVPPSPVPASPQPPPPPPPTAPTHPLPISSLKQVRFRMSSLKVVYPINNGTLDPIAPADEAQTRDRIEEEWRKEKMGIRVNGVPDPTLDHPAAAAAGERRTEKQKGKGKDESQAGGGGEEVKASRVYTGEELARVYAEACRTREEPGIERLGRFFRVGLPPLSLSHLLLSLAPPSSGALTRIFLLNKKKHDGPQDNPKSLPKVLDLSHELLSSGAVAALSDILAIDWGCKKLVLDGCGLDDDVRFPPTLVPSHSHSLKAALALMHPLHCFTTGSQTATAVSARLSVDPDCQLGGQQTDTAPGLEIPRGLPSQGSSSSRSHEHLPDFSFHSDATRCRLLSSGISTCPKLRLTAKRPNGSCKPLRRSRRRSRPSSTTNRRAKGQTARPRRCRA